MKIISVILPTLNEKDNIIKLIDSIELILKDRTLDIIVVDDNSTDGTWQLVETRSKNDSEVSLIRRIDKRGLTSALCDGIESSKGEILVWMDADFSMPPEKIAELLLEVEKGADIAVGSRYVAGGKDERGQKYWLQVFLSKLLWRLTSIFLDSNFKDYSSGFIAIRRETIKDLGLRGDYGEYFIDLIYRAIGSGYRCKEVPYILAPRVYGESKTSTFSCGWKYLWTIVRLRLGI